MPIFGGQGSSRHEQEVEVTADLLCRSISSICSFVCFSTFTLLVKLYVIITLGEAKVCASASVQLCYLLAFSTSQIIVILILCKYVLVLAERSDATCIKTSTRLTAITEANRYFCGHCMVVDGI